jgi:hypothetical protein
MATSPNEQLFAAVNAETIQLSRFVDGGAIAKSNTTLNTYGGDAIAWAPDSSRLAVVNNYGARIQVVAGPPCARGTEHFPFTSGGRLLAWSPDSRHVLCVSSHSAFIATPDPYNDRTHHLFPPLMRGLALALLCAVRSLPLELMLLLLEHVAQQLDQ